MRTHRLFPGVLLAAGMTWFGAAVPVPVPAAAQESARPQPLVMQVTGSPLLATIDLPGFANNPIAMGKLREDHGDNALAAGSATGGVLMTIVAHPDRAEPPLDSAGWRKKLHTDTDDTEQFEHGDVACVDDTRTQGSLQLNDFHAWVVAAGRCFHIHANQLGDPEDDGCFTKRKFRALVDTFRVGNFRHGTFADYSAEVVDGFHAVASKYPAWKAAADAAAAAKPDDWVTAFVVAEASNAFGAPEADRAAACEKAAELLAKAKPTDARSLTAWASMEDALAAFDHASGKFKLAVAHLKHAAELCAASSPAVRGSIHYAYARSLTKAVAPMKDSIAALEVAIGCDPKRREAAVKEPDFAGLRSNKDFKALVAPPK